MVECEAVLQGSGQRQAAEHMELLICSCNVKHANSIICHSIRDSACIMFE